MGYKCVGEVARLLGDKDIRSMATCLIDGVQGCSQTLWDCMGDSSCHSELRCWIDGITQASSDIWKMVTDEAKRAFDKELITCMSDCYYKRKNPLAKALCIAGSCGLHASKCLADRTCRAAFFTDLPAAAFECAPASLKDPKFTAAAKCAAQMADTCGRSGIELLRDQNLAKIVTCNAQCTRPPHQQIDIVV